MTKPSSLNLLCFKGKNCLKWTRPLNLMSVSSELYSLIDFGCAKFRLCKSTCGTHSLQALDSVSDDGTGGVSA